MDANKPAIEVKPPSNRHYIHKVRQNSLAKTRNTVIEPSIPIKQDITDINTGKAIYQKDENGIDIYAINGRIYGVKPDGRSYPIEGQGFYQLNRSSYKALGVYNQFGQTICAENILDKMGTDSIDRQTALKIWKNNQKSK
jgi:hypothetical protein